MLRLLLTTITITLCLVACVPGHNDYSEFANIPPVGWDYRQPVEFTPVLTDSAATGELVIAIRHTNAYPFSNIWVELNVMYTDSTLRERTDTLNIHMADVYGHWYGHGLGSSYQLTDTLPAPVCLHNGDRIRLRHIMRPDTLPAIEQIGILFKES